MRAALNGLAVIALLLDAGAPAASDSDPIEPVNRGIFRFNEVADGVLLKPLAHIYLGIVPVPAQHGLHNALSNLTSPVVFLNSVLQGDVHNAGYTLSRFVINSTLGIVGIFDVASDFGMPYMHSKDFGQTLGVYGVGGGPYIVVPILGPSNSRDLVGFIVDFFADPFNYILTTNETIVLDVAKTVTKRADYLPLTDRIYRDSFDPYVTYRSIYTQNRAKVVRDYLNRDSRLEKDTGK
jgi:phospholipid-binding lipoprotein MlaA